MRIPLRVRWPGAVKSDTKIVTPVSKLDLFPTLTDIAGIARPSMADTDGVSLAELLKKGTPPKREAFYIAATRPESTGDLFLPAIFSGGSTPLQFPTENRIELYDLGSVPTGSKNLAEVRPADRDRLFALLDAWRKEVGASMKPKLKKSKKEKR